MADFVQSINIKSEVRTLVELIKDFGTSNTVFESIIPPTLLNRVIVPLSIPQFVQYSNR